MSIQLVLFVPDVNPHNHLQGLYPQIAPSFYVCTARFMLWSTVKAGTCEYDFIFIFFIAVGYYLILITVCVLRFLRRLSNPFHVVVGICFISTPKQSCKEYPTNQIVDRKRIIYV